MTRKLVNRYFVVPAEYYSYTARTHGELGYLPQLGCQSVVNGKFPKYHIASFTCNVGKSSLSRAVNSYCKCFGFGMSLQIP